MVNSYEPLLVPPVERCVFGVSPAGGVHGEDEGVVHAQLLGHPSLGAYIFSIVECA